ncbi:MAG: hypothetical protein ACON5H_07910 [Akkermansiaceae bacterium]
MLPCLGLSDEAPSHTSEALPQYQIEREKAVGEKFEKLRTIKGKVYENATLREVNDQGMRIIHSGGVARIPLAELTYKLRKRFGYDPKRTAAEAAKEQAQRQAHREKTEKIAQKNREVRKEKDREHTKKMLSKKKQTKIAELEKRIQSMTTGIEKARVEIQSLKVKAADYRARGRRWVDVTGSNGRTYQVERVTKTLLNRAITTDKRIAKIELQIVEANAKIRELTQQKIQVEKYQGD